MHVGGVGGASIFGSAAPAAAMMAMSAPPPVAGGRNRSSVRGVSSRGAVTAHASQLLVVLLSASQSGKALTMSDYLRAGVPLQS